MMPRMDGFEVCRRLKKDARTAHIPILMVTALSERMERLMGIAAGANDFLTKPVDLQELTLRVGHAVHTKHLFDQLQAEQEKCRTPAPQHSAPLHRRADEEGRSQHRRTASRCDRAGGRSGGLHDARRPHRSGAGRLSAQRNLLGLRRARPKSTAWRKSRPSATPTWWPAAFRCRAPTMPRPSPNWPSTCMAEIEQVQPRLQHLHPPPHWHQHRPGRRRRNWALEVQPTTFGAKPSTSPAAWNRSARPAPSRSPTGPLNGSRTSIASTAVGPLTSKGPAKRWFTPSAAASESPADAKSPPGALADDPPAEESPTAG